MPDYSKNFLTSMTGHINFDDEPDNVNTGDPAPAKPSRLPLPDYKNPQSRLKYAEAFRNKYGDVIAGMGDTPLRINEKPINSNLTSKQLSQKIGNQYGIDPALLYTSSMHEGMSGIYP